jgi:branched-chain amino acid transport system permease protein
MSSLIIQLLNGLSYGLLIFMLAAGLTLMFGLMRVVNMAHGSYYLLAGYLGYTVSKLTGDFLIAILAGIVLGGILGFLMERFLFRLIYNMELEQVLLTFGFIYIFQDIGLWLWPRSVLVISKPAWLTGSLTFFDITFPLYRIALIVVGLVIAALLWYFQEKTRVGAMVRAGVDDREMVTALGINVNKLFTLIFTLGAALAGLAGVLGAAYIGLFPGLDLEVLILALVVVVIGGLGSLTGTLAAALLIGLADAFGKALIPEFAMFSVYAVMALVLIFRPTGLLGRKE